MESTKGSHAIVRNLDNPEKSFTFLDGSKRTVVILDSVAIGRGEYKVGWKWSEHVGKQTGKAAEAHIGYIVSGKMVVKSPDGKEVVVGPGDAFELGPNHDAWVLGDESCLALDFEKLE